MTEDAEGVVPASTIAGIALACTLVPLNSTMIAVGLPDIARDFDISTRQASVLITLYLAAMLVGQPLAGRLCDRVGARRLATIATIGFGGFSAVAMVATSFSLLVGLRALQAAFASALVPSVQAMLRELVPPRQYGRAFGLQGSVIGVGAGLGPLVGGLVTAAWGWRAIFGVNLPVVLAVLYVLQRRVAGAPPSTTHAREMASAGSAVGFSAVFRAAFATQALANLVLYAFILAMPIVLDARGWSASWIGLWLSALTVGLVATGPYGGHLGDVHGRRRPVTLGLAAALFAVGASALGGDQVPTAVLLATLLLLGLGLGVAAPGITAAGIEAAPPDRTGAAAGLLSASRYVGSIASTIVLAGVLGEDGDGLATLLVVCGVGLAASLVVARALPGRVRDAVVR